MRELWKNFLPFIPLVVAVTFSLYGLSIYICIRYTHNLHVSIVRAFISTVIYDVNICTLLRRILLFYIFLMVKILRIVKHLANICVNLKSDKRRIYNGLSCEIFWEWLIYFLKSMKFWKFMPHLGLFLISFFELNFKLFEFKFWGYIYLRIHLKLP